jgi:hypothetical protein
MGMEPERSRAAEPAPAAFHYGPGHMIMHGNAVFVTMFGRGVVGQPAREAMIGLPVKAFELMDLVYAAGKPGACRLTTSHGEKRLVVAPRRDPDTGEIYGVTTHLRPVAASLE